MDAAEIERFQQLWDYDSPTWARKFLDAWVKPSAFLR